MAFNEFYNHFGATVHDTIQSDPRFQRTIVPADEFVRISAWLDEDEDEVPELAAALAAVRARETAANSDLSVGVDLNEI